MIKFYRIIKNNINILYILLFLFIYIILISVSKLNIIKSISEKISKYININYFYESKVCLCLIAKKENLYIKHFLEYYRKLGFKKIFLYDNNDINDEKFEDVIKNEINSGFVSIINYRGFRGNGKMGAQQMNAYYDCYKKNNLFYDWIAFFDADEYLVLYKDKNIQKFLTSSRYKNCEIIRYIKTRIYQDLHFVILIIGLFLMIIINWSLRINL